MLNNKNVEKMKFKKLYYFFMLCLFLLGSIGGIGYTIYCDAYVICVGIIGLSYMALPTALDYFDILKS